MKTNYADRYSNTSVYAMATKVIASVTTTSLSICLLSVILAYFSFRQEPGEFLFTNTDLLLGVSAFVLAIPNLACLETVIPSKSEGILEPPSNALTLQPTG